jgi:hypothetical protein
MNVNVKDESQSALVKTSFVKQDSDVNEDDGNVDGKDWELSADDDLEDDFLFRDSYIEDRDLGMHGGS